MILNKKTKIITASAIGSVVTSVLASLAHDIITNLPFLSGVKQFIGWLYNGILFVFNVELKLWYVLVFLILIFILRLFIKRYKKEEQEDLPAFLDYTCDVFEGITWRWEWSYIYHGYQITDLTPYCPNDDTPLVKFLMAIQYSCPRCKYRTSRLANESDISILIFDNIRKRGLNE